MLGCWYLRLIPIQIYASLDTDLLEFILFYFFKNADILNLIKHFCTEVSYNRAAIKHNNTNVSTSKHSKDKYKVS